MGDSGLFIDSPYDLPHKVMRINGSGEKMYSVMRHLEDGPNKNVTHRRAKKT